MDTARRAIRRSTAFGPWLGLATVVFTGWYVCFLFPHRAVGVLSSLASAAHGTVPLVPLVSDAALRSAVATVIDLGLPVTVLAFAVGFGLFHRQAETG